MREWKNEEEERAGARKKALALLLDMDRTESGLKERLRKSGFSAAAADDALEYVKGYGYVDDRKYAKHFVEVAGAKRSRRRMEYDLLKRGVPRELIEEAMAENGPRDERPLIRELAMKKLKRMDAEDPGTRKRLAAALGRQGFGAEDVIAVVDDIMAESHP